MTGWQRRSRRGLCQLWSGQCVPAGRWKPTAETGRSQVVVRNDRGTGCSPEAGLPPILIRALTPINRLFRNRG